MSFAGRRLLSSASVRQEGAQPEPCDGGMGADRMTSIALGLIAALLHWRSTRAVPRRRGRPSP
jgi:hypothetical protein